MDNLHKLNNQPIIVCLYDDISIRWVHYLDFTKIIVEDNFDYTLYKSRECYFLYYKKDLESLIVLVHKLKLKNYVHWILTDFQNVDYALTQLDTINDSNFDYSILNHMGENIFEDNPRNLNLLSNYKYYFSCSNVLKKGKNNINTVSSIELSNKMILDFRYSLVYFYIKCGFNFFDKGILKFDNKNKKPGVFVYGKSADRTWRNDYMKYFNESNKLYVKSFEEEDFFWSRFNNNLYHTPFIIDYNSYYFNLVFETQPPFEQNNFFSNFITEKTLKSLMVETPSYVLLQPDTFKKLTNDGFYFLNLEFGEYNFDNYENFSYFIINSKDKEIEELYHNSLKKSKLNKILLEDYIYSYKQKEINLLIHGK